MGLGVMLLPAPYRQLDGLAEVECSPALSELLAEIPNSELWIAGHRANRDVPRIAAVWTWLVELFGGLAQPGITPVPRRSEVLLDRPR